MKISSIYKGRRVGLATIERPQIMKLMDAVSVLAFADRTSGVIVIPKSKKGMEIVVMKAIRVVEKVGEGITTVKPGDFVITFHPWLWGV